MRVAYQNLIDDVSSASIVASSSLGNYPVTNVQTQTLTKPWISDTGTTAQTVVVTLDTFPEYPDNATGTTAIYTFNATAEAFTGVGGVATTGTYVGCISMTATTANSRIERTGPAVASSSTIILRARSTTAAATSFSVVFGATASTAVATLSGMGTSFTVLSGVVAGPATAATAIRLIANNTSSSGSVFDIDWMYIGNGDYTSTLLDNSGNGNNATVVGAIKDNSYDYPALDFDGVNDYFTVTFSNSFSGAIVVSMHIVIPTPAPSIYCLYTSGGLATEGSFFVTTQSGNLYLYLIGAGGINNHLCGYISQLASGSYHLVFGYDPTDLTANTLFLYVNNVKQTLTDSSTISTRPAILNATQYIACSSPSSSSFNGKISDVKLYNRRPSASEIDKLYQGISFPTENFGLVADWTLDKNLGVNTVAILGHNIQTDMQVKIQGNNSNEWGDPEVDETLTINPTTILKFLSSTYYYKYWRFYIYGQGSLKIGRLWLGTYLTIDPSSLLDFKVTKKRSDKVIYGKERQKIANKGVGWRRFEFSFPPSNESMISSLVSFIRTVRSWKSFIFTNLDTDYSYTLVTPCYVSLENPTAFTHTDRMKMNYTLVMEEEK